MTRIRRSSTAGLLTLGVLAGGLLVSVTPALAAPEVPVVATGEAQSIGQTAATLSGTVNPEGMETTYYFAYVDQAGYAKALAGDSEEKANPYAEGETTATLELTEIVEQYNANSEKVFVAVPYAGYEPQTVGPTPATGLLPGQTYHYRLVAQNEFEGTVDLGYGKDATFATQPGTPPLVTTGGVSAVSQNSATLYGTVTTNGLQTNYGFEIGTEPNNNYGGGWGPSTGLGAIGGAQTETVSVTLGELQPGTTYYYRVTATNADGTKQGEPESFTTPGFPTLLVAPTSPPPIANPAIVFPKEEPGSSTSTRKTLTSAQKLAAALKACKKDKSKSKRAKCERAAKKKYPVAKKKKRS